MKRQLFAVAYLRTATREPENVDKLLRQLNACHKTAFTRRTASAEVFIDYDVTDYEQLVKDILTP